MPHLVVQSMSFDYPIYIDENIRFQLNHYIKKSYSSVMVVTDENVSNLYLTDVLTNIVHDKVYQAIIPQGETSKSIHIYYKLLTKAITYGLDRQSLIIALGGGVVGDIAGFVAATFMRGIDYIQMPTTILAHDSSVGGKVAINHELGKNLIGSFYPPQAVIYDTAMLHSLSNRDIRSGYAELIKEALIADASFFKELIHTDIYSVTTKQLGDHLLSGISIKAKIVEFDETEFGERKYLNLGHTLGHALEAEIGYGQITHGEAVAIGLLFALWLSEHLYNVQLPVEIFYQWLKKNAYPLSISNLNVSSVIEKMKRDKKVVGNHIQLILLKDLTNPVITHVSDESLYKYLQTFFKTFINKIS